jgi:hypothetical protein
MPDNSKKHYRIWRATPDSDACVMVNETAAVIAANQSTFVAVSECGVSIAGPVSFNVTSESIRYGGLFVSQNDFVKMIPTTIVTPIPSQIPYPPLAFSTAILKEMPFFLAALI